MEICCTMVWIILLHFKYFTNKLYNTIIIMATRKQLITEKYATLLNEVKPYTDISIFPSLDKVPIAEAVIYTTMLFPDYNNIDDTLKQLIKMNNVKIDDENYVIVRDIFKEYLKWLNGLK